VDESKTGCLFVFLQHFHDALKEAMEIDIRTIMGYRYNSYNVLID